MGLMDMYGPPAPMAQGQKKRGLFDEILAPENRPMLAQGLMALGQGMVQNSSAQGYQPGFMQALSGGVTAAGQQIEKKREEMKTKAVYERIASAKTPEEMMAAAQDSPELFGSIATARMENMFEPTKYDMQKLGNQIVRTDPQTGVSDVVFTGAGADEKPPTSTELKEIFDSSDVISSSEGAKSALLRAKTIMADQGENKPYSGFGASMRTQLARLPDGLVPDALADKGRAAATTEARTLVQEQALGNMKAIFGGNPTEGERQILMQMQALPDFTPEEQQKIIDNATQAIDRRIEFNKRKMKAVETRDYSGLTEQPAAPSALSGSPQAGMVEDGYRFKGGNPSDPNAWEKVQ
jgi:hypothetical protein